jgi:hypothetical protein
MDVVTKGGMNTDPPLMPMSVPCRLRRVEV